MEQQLDDLKTGKRKAEIWNGSLNCFKIGLSVDVEAKKATQKLGWLYPTKLYLTHYTQVTEEQAQLVGEKLSDLKKKIRGKQRQVRWLYYHGRL